MTARLVLCVLGLLVAAAPAAAESCRLRSAEPGRPKAGRNCPPQPARKLEPYEPDRLRAGSQPGFIDLGSGTEVRVGGRARFEYGVRR